jgi:hypothetical protein
MERLSRGSCALVLANGEETFAFRRELWQMVMGACHGRSDFHLTCALNYLLCTGRRTHLANLAWPGRYDRPLDEVVEYYENCFGLFGNDGQATRKSILATLAPYVEDGRVRSEGRVEVGVIFWERP